MSVSIFDDIRGSRGQTAVIGTILAVGLVTLFVSGIGVFYISEIDGTEDTPQVNCEITFDAADDNVTITHAGGDEVDTADLDVVLQNASSTSRLAFGIDEGDGDQHFETGETGRFGSISTDTDVILVTEQSVVCSDTARV